MNSNFIENLTIWENFTVFKGSDAGIGLSVYRNHNEYLICNKKNDVRNRNWVVQQSLHQLTETHSLYLCLNAYALAVHLCQIKQSMVVNCVSDCVEWPKETW